MSRPTIGRFSSEQLRFTRNTGYKRSDFEQDTPRVTRRDAIMWATLAIAVCVALKVLTS